MKYHYCAFYQESETGSLVYDDGVVTTQVPVDTLARYNELKQAINPNIADRLTILTLTPLPEQYVQSPLH